MSSDTTTIGLLLVAGLGLLALAAVLLSIALRQGRRQRRQGRLQRGFERARTVARSGSGVQGTPYSVYGEAAWTNAPRARD